MSKQVIIIGGGLSGLSAAHTIIERGGNTLLLDKNGFLGGNSTKATSGINGALTRTQIQKGIKDSVEKFAEDTALSASRGKSKEVYPLAKVLTYQSGSAVEWLQEKFELDLSLVSRLGGHTFPRTHRGKERFPGMTITYALIAKYEELVEKKDGRARLITKARVTKLHKDSDGHVTGVDYVKDGKTFTEHGPVIIATGGYGADYGDDSLLKKHRPELLPLPTTNGEHCTGDGIKIAQAIGADLKDIEAVQVHPTGLVQPEDPSAKVKWLAAEALRGTGGLLLDGNGNRFADELGRRDYVTGEMNKTKGPHRLVLNSASAKEIEWHCKHYQSRRLMKHFNNGAELAKEIGISPDALKTTFEKYNKNAKEEKDDYGKKFFQNAPYSMTDSFYVAIVCPVVHYCMGGLHVSPASEVISTDGKVIPGLWAAGEVMGGTHGLNRLGGSSLLDCVVFGRVSGEEASRYLLQSHLKGSSKAYGRIAGLSKQLGGGSGIKLHVDPSTQRLSLEVSWGGSGTGSAGTGSAQSATSDGSSEDHTPSGENSAASSKNEDAELLQVEAAAKKGAQGSGGSASSSSSSSSAGTAKGDKKGGVYSVEEVAKHNKETDCWVIVDGQVLNVTKFLPDHPGGAKAILLYAGKDATEEFNMLHKPEVIPKYAPDSVIGTVEGHKAKL